MFIEIFEVWAKDNNIIVDRDIWDDLIDRLEDFHIYYVNKKENYTYD